MQKCWTCKKFASCDWSRYDQKENRILFKPIDGWVAVPREIKDSTTTIETYEIIECPEYDGEAVAKFAYTCKCGAPCITGKRICKECLEKKERENEITRKGNRKTISERTRFSSNICDAARIAIQARYDELEMLHGAKREAMRRKIYKEAGCCPCGGKRMAGRRVCKRCYETKERSLKKCKTLKKEEK